MTRPPVTTPFWIGDTVYRRHGDKNAGIVIVVSFQNDPAFPSMLYNVTWPKKGETTDHYACELTKTRPAKEDKEFVK